MTELNTGEKRGSRSYRAALPKNSLGIGRYHFGYNWETRRFFSPRIYITLVAREQVLCHGEWPWLQWPLDTTKTEGVNDPREGTQETTKYLDEKWGACVIYKVPEKGRGSVLKLRKILGRKDIESRTRKVSLRNSEVRDF